MNLKESVYLHALPATPHSDLEHEQQYLARLRESLEWVKGSVEANAREIGEKYVRREECERLVEEKDQTIAALQAENYQLRVGNEQYQRYLKRYEMKHELLNNKVYHLTKAIAEKDAIIKYLEGKALAPTPAPAARPLNDSLHDCPSRTYSKPNLSFAKLKSTSSLMTFQDYANCSMQLPVDPTKRTRGDRVRTESSSDLKENESMDNIKPVGGMAVNKLAGFFNTNMFGSVENQKTLTKAHSTTAQQNASFWQYSKPNQEGREQRRHSNFSTVGLPPNHFYRE